MWCTNSHIRIPQSSAKNAVKSVPQKLRKLVSRPLRDIPTTTTMTMTMITTTITTIITTITTTATTTTTSTATAKPSNRTKELQVQMYPVELSNGGLSTQV